VTQHCAVIDAPPSAVWDALTRPALMAMWMGDRETGVEVETSWVVGAPIIVRGFHHAHFVNTGADGHGSQHAGGFSSGNIHGARRSCCMRAGKNVLAVAAGIAALGAAACPSQRLQNGHLSSFARFGRSISISGQTAAVGAYQEDDAASEQGAVYVYIQTGDVWNLQARLVVSGGASDDQFGDVVALSDSGDTLAVSATLADAPGANRAGAVYVFQRSGTSWTQQAKLSPPSPEAFQAFGVSLALDGNRLVVGSVDRDQGTAVDAGAAYVYNRTGSSWGAPAVLAGPTPASQDKFGSSVAVVGDAVFVGALRRNLGGLAAAGAVYVYGPSGTTWTLGQTLTASDAQAGDVFGSALAVSASATIPNTRYLVVGAIDADLGGGLTDAGAAYLFTSTSGGAFTQTQKLVAADAAAGDFFASAVALSNDRVLVGAAGATATALRAGAAYVFDLAGGAWSQTAKLVSATGAPDDHLGGAVAISGSLALAGATEEQVEPGLSSAGTVHAFREVTPGAWSASQRLAAAESLPQDLYGGAVAVSSDTLVAAARGSVDVYRRDLDGWSLTQTIPAAAGARVTSVSTDAGRLAFFSRHNPLSTDPLGTVDVYLRGVDGSWALEQELVPDLVSTAEPQESADASVVVLSGDRLAIGSRRFNGGDGRVFVYTRSGSTWTQVQLLESAIAATNFDMNFGNSVALDGDTLVVSEPPSSGFPNPASPRIGQVHVYGWNGSAFAAAQTITAPSPADLDQFGRGVALSGDYLAIRGEISGSGRTVRVYRRNAGVFSATWTLSGSDVPLDTGLAFDQEGPSLGHPFVTLRLAVGSPTFAVGSAASAGAVLVYQRQPNDTFVQSTIWIPFDFASGKQFGSVVGFSGGHLVATNALSASTPGDVYGTDP